MEEQQKATIDTIQAELRTLHLKTDTLQTSVTQVQTPLAASTTVLATEESHLYSLPSTALVGLQLQAGADVQLDMAKLPHEALQGLHATILQEIHHQDHKVHQQHSVAEQTVAQQNA